MDRFVTDNLDGWNFHDEQGQPLAHEDLLKQQPLPPGPTVGDYSKVPPTTGEEFSAQFKSGPMTWFHQAAQRGAYADDPARFDRFAHSIEAFFHTDPENKLYNQILSPVEANEAFAPKGEDWFDKYISFGLAKITADQRREKTQITANLQRYSEVHSWPFNLGVNAVGFMLDPANLGASMVPGLGEEAIAARLGGGVVARLAGRAAAGAVGGAAAMVPSVAARGAFDENYSLREAFFDLAMGAAGGAVLQGVLPGVAREAGLLKPDKLMTDAARQTLVEGLTRDVTALGQTAEQIHTAQSVAVGQTAAELPIDVLPITHPPASDLQVRNMRTYPMSQSMLAKTPEDVVLRAASIAGRAGEHQADLAWALQEARKVTDLPVTLAQVAAKQIKLHEEGSALGVSQEDFLRAKEEVDAAARSEPIEPATTGPGAPTASDTGAPAGEAKAVARGVAPIPELIFGELPPPVKEGETSLFKATVAVNGESKIVQAPWDPQQIAQALREAGVDPGIAEAQGGLVQVQAQEAAYNQAAQCLVEAGI